MTKIAQTKLKLIDTTGRFVDERDGITRETRTYKLGDEKFQIFYENSNGWSLGFNYKMCLKQYSKSDAKWNNLEDHKVLNMTTLIPSYFNFPSTKKHADEFFKLMEQRLEKVYS